MNIFTIYSYVFIFIDFRPIIYGIAAHNVGISFDDMSLSEETKRNLTEIADPVIRLNFERQAKILKYYRKHLNPAMGYIAFQCAVNKMRADMEVFYPQCSTPSDYKAFMKGLVGKLPFSKELEVTIRLFTDVEITYSVPSMDRAQRKIPLFFDSMYAFLSRCFDARYAGYLPTENLSKADILRARVLALNGLTEEDSWDKKRSAFMEFSNFYARIRHGCNGFPYLYDRILQNSTKDLAEQLYSMGLLQAWSFTVDDVKYANMLRSAVSNDTSTILTNPYRFEVTKEEGEPALVTGVLPIVDLKYCPRFVISR